METNSEQSFRLQWGENAITSEDKGTGRTSHTLKRFSETLGKHHRGWVLHFSFLSRVIFTCFLCSKLPNTGHLTGYRKKKRKLCRNFQPDYAEESVNYVTKFKIASSSIYTIICLLLFIYYWVFHKLTHCILYCRDSGWRNCRPERLGRRKKRRKKWKLTKRKLNTKHRRERRPLRGRRPFSTTRLIEWRLFTWVK